MNVINITHTDWDGVTCAVLVKHAFPDATIIHSDYNKVDERVIESIHSLEENGGGALFITDLSPSSDEAIAAIDRAYLNPNISVVMIDHHKTSYERLFSKEWAVIDLHWCGAALTEEYLTAMGFNLKKYKRLVELTNDYDRWIHRFPESLVLNDLLYATTREHFVQRCLSMDSPHCLTPNDEFLLQFYNEKKRRYVHRCCEGAVIKIDEAGNRVALAFAEDHTNDIGNALAANGDCDYAMVINYNKRKVSLRATAASGLNVEELATQHENGGGHYSSAGYYLDNKTHIQICKWLTEV